MKNMAFYYADEVFKFFEEIKEAGSDTYTGYIIYDVIGVIG